MLYNPTKFSGHGYCSIRFIIILVYHVIPQQHVIKGSYDFMGGSLSW